MLKHFGHGLGGSEAAEALLGSLAGSMATLGLEPLLQSLKLMALTAQQEPCGKNTKTVGKTRGGFFGGIGWEERCEVLKKNTEKMLFF